MAVSANFKADFSSFINAIQKADVELADFGKGADKVQTQLNKMVDNFQGRAVVQQATLMGAAIEKVGGLSALSAQQIETVAKAANEAAATMNRLGIEGASSMQQFADKVNNARGFTFDLSKAAEVAAGAIAALGVNASLSGIAQFVKGLFDAADSLVKLSDKTGVSVEALQKFQVIGDDAGNTVDQITAAITKMENKLSGGDAKAVDALGKLGLAFEDIQKLTPENQFIAISDAIRKIDDPAQQVNIAMALFGKAGAEILPTLKKGFDDVKNSASTMSAETVKAFDDAGDAIGRWWRTTKGVTAEAIVAFVHLVEDGFDPQTHAVAELGREAEATARQIGAMTKQAQLLRPPLQTLQPDDLAAKFAELSFDLDKSNAAMTKSREEAQKNADAQAKYSAEVTKTVAADKNQVIALEALIPGLVSGTDQFNNVRDAIGGLLAKGLIVPDMLKNWYDANKQVLSVTKDFSGVMATLPDVISATSDTLNNLTSSANEFHDGITVAGDEIKTVMIPAFTTLTKGVMPQMAKEIEKAGDTIDKSFGERVQGVLGDFSSILSHVHGAFAELANVAVHTGQAILKNLASGDLWGAIISGIGGVVTAFGKLFSNPEKQINPIREAFVQLNGGLAELNEKAHAAGVTLTALLNAKNPEAYTKAIDDLNAAFKFQDDAMKTLDDTVQKYGFSIQELGPAFAAQKLSEQAGTLLQDYQVLTAAGVDHVAIINKMGPALNDYVKQSILAGTAIPSSMKPVLQSMVDLGELTDENGNKLTDLSQLTFSDTLDKKFSTLIDTINKLTDAISRGLGTAIQNLPTRKEIEIVTVYSDVDNRTQGGGDTAFAARGGLVTSGGVQYLAGGGKVLSWPSRGTDTVPAMLTPGEGIVSRRGMASLGRAGLSAINSGAAGGSGVTVVNHFNVAADINTSATREKFRKAVDDATMQALRRQKRVQLAS